MAPGVRRVLKIRICFCCKGMAGISARPRHAHSHAKSLYRALVLKRKMPHCSVNLSDRSEEHTSELQSLMRNSYAVFCLKKKKTKQKTTLGLHKTTLYKSIMSINTCIYINK